jgi:hypothetical protein
MWSLVLVVSYLSCRERVPVMSFCWKHETSTTMIPSIISKEAFPVMLTYWKVCFMSQHITKEKILRFSRPNYLNVVPLQQPIFLDLCVRVSGEGTGICSTALQGVRVNKRYWYAFSSWIL